MVVFDLFIELLLFFLLLSLCAEVDLFLLFGWLDLSPLELIKVPL